MQFILASQKRLVLVLIIKKPPERVIIGEVFLDFNIDGIKSLLMPVKMLEIDF